MDARTKRRIRQGHAGRLARRALAQYPRGARRRVAETLGVSPSRLSHLVTDDVHPVLHDAFRLLLDVRAVDDATAQGFAQAVQDAVELRPIIEAPTQVLVERRDHLVDVEHDLEAAENRAALTGTGYPAALRREAHAQLELANILDEIEARRGR